MPTIQTATDPATKSGSNRPQGSIGTSGIGGGDPWQIDETTVECALTIAEWFKAETLRIRHLMTESELMRELRQVAEWINSTGGTITARDFCRNRRDIESTEEAEAIL